MTDEQIVRVADAIRDAMVKTMIRLWDGGYEYDCKAMARAALAAADGSREMTDAAKALRTKLCIESECTFDAGCGCLDAIRAALAAAQAGATDVEKAKAFTQRLTRSWSAGFAAGIETDEIERLQAEIERMLKALCEAGDEILRQRKAGAEWQEKYKKLAGPSEADMARMAEAIQKSIERGCDITPPESMVAARAAYLALLQRGKK